MLYLQTNSMKKIKRTKKINSIGNAVTIKCYKDLDR